MRKLLLVFAVILFAGACSSPTGLASYCDPDHNSECGD